MGPAVFFPGQSQTSCPSLPGTGGFLGHGAFSAETGKVPCKLDDSVTLPWSHAKVMQAVRIRDGV